MSNPHSLSHQFMFSWALVRMSTVRQSRRQGLEGTKAQGQGREWEDYCFRWRHLIGCHYTKPTSDWDLRGRKVPLSAYR